MATDSSLASQVEDWIVATIRADSAFDDSNVEPFIGWQNPSGQELVEQFKRHSSPFVAVLWESDVIIPLEEGEIRIEPTYGIYVVVQSQREGIARRGDGTFKGTNGLRDILRSILHDKFPGKSATGMATDNTVWKGVRVVYPGADAFVVRAELVVHEAPTA